MKKLSVKELVIATNGKLLCGDENILIDNVVIDSREVNTSSLFLLYVAFPFQRLFFHMFHLS